MFLLNYKTYFFFLPNWKNIPKLNAQKLVQKTFKGKLKLKKKTNVI